jgi:hypothetical protein
MPHCGVDGPSPESSTACLFSVSLTGMSFHGYTRLMKLTRTDQIHARIEAFVAELDALIRQSTLDLVEQTLGQPTLGKSARRVRSGATLAAAAEPGTPTAATSARRGKRTKEQLEALTNALLKYIGKNPGHRMEQISAGMKISSKELTLAMQKLKAEGHLKTKGQKRATAYFVK